MGPDVVSAREPLLGISRGLAQEDENPEASATEFVLFAANAKGPVVTFRRFPPLRALTLGASGFWGLWGPVELLNFVANDSLDFLRRRVF